MPIELINGIPLNYQDTGTGEPVVLVMGATAGGQVWHLHQVPALVAAGYRVVTFDNRGTGPTDGSVGGFTIQDLVSDVAALVEHLGFAPTRVVGASLGAYVVQELALARPDLVRQAVLIATKGRVDTMRAALTAAEVELHDRGMGLPPSFAAVFRALLNFSPRTLANDDQAADWLALLRLSAQKSGNGGPGVRAQLALEPVPGRLGAYRAITVPCHVIAFADDLVSPPHLGREVAEAIPRATLEIVAGCGHFGYLEEPDLVNKSLVEFFDRDRVAGPDAR